MSGTIVIITVPPPPPKKEPEPDGFAQLIGMPFAEARQVLDRAEAEGWTLRMVVA